MAAPRPVSGRFLILCFIAAAVALLVAASAPPAQAQTGPCAPPVTNEIACENSKPGNPESEWDVSGSGSSSIQGFATDISVDQGQIVNFKIDSATSLYRLDIYRMGWYGGQGARRVATVRPLSGLSSQPACTEQASTGLIDCGNWSVSASWTVPADAVSGIYFAKLVREDGTTGSSHVVFVVRDDDGQSELLFQTSDTTWQAYNEYGGNSLYVGSPDGRAYKVSYNRPFTTRGDGAEDWVFNAEYPMVRWLERNSYDVSYSTGLDSHRLGAELLEHETFLSVGHDEYWSGGQRTNVEAARAAGVNLAFFSGNEIFWKTRWEPSIAGPTTANRTLVTYKETHADAKIDPTPGVWTGTWRDPRFSPPADGGRPENALSGQLFMVNAGATTAIQVPSAEGKMRFWRNTTVANLAAGATATLPQGTLGYEWDTDPENGHRPPGSVRMSSTTVTGAPVLQDHGSTFGSGTAVHNMSLYKHTSGALVFGAGTVQWSWGLDDQHDRGTAAPDVRMQQATANLLSDMGAQPGTLQSGLVMPTRTTDATAPTSTITSPAQGAQLSGGQVTITGTATDAGGGVVGAVEVSVDGGNTWRLANGRASWTYSWTPSGSGSFNIRSRATDDSANRETPSAGVTGTVGAGSCPCSIWSSSTLPTNETEPTDNSAVEVGVKFRATVDGHITGIRFYKGTTNTGTHVGHLWSSTGTMLAEATFTGETPRGWQQVNLSAPVAVTAGTTYVASYHAPVGHYAWNRSFFAAGGVDSGPLRALSDAESGGNGVYGYGPSRTFPNNTYLSENYWVDVVFQPGTATDTTPPTVSTTVPANGATGVSAGVNAAATFSEPLNPSTVSGTTFELRGPGGTLVPATVTYDAATRTATLDPTAALAETTTYTATVKGGASGVKDQAGNALAADRVWSFTTAALPPPGGGGCPCSIWDGSTLPTNETEPSDTDPVEVGVKFRPSVDGTITGIRFYKGTTNTGTHVGHLWSSTGTMLGEATFTGETPRGWQEVTLPSPVNVTAGTTYVASYHAPVGNYAWNRDFFATAGVDSGPLRALSNAESGGNGVYAYGPSRSFPSNTFRSENYWVDVVFQTGAPDTQAPTVTETSPAGGAAGVGLAANVTATFSEAMKASTISSSTVELRTPAGALVPAAVTYDAATRRVTLDPTAALAENTTYMATVKGGAGGVEDTSGNVLATNRTWSFTTITDATPPTVTAIEPANGATGVATSANVTATFSEAMTAASIGTGTVELRGPGGALVPAAVTYDATNRRAVLDPTSALAVGTAYTATVRSGATGVKDAAGNALASDRVWAFTTAGDVTPPTVTDTDPDNNATNVAPGANVAATFSEPLNAATVSGSSFELRDPAGNAVAATVAYDAVTRTATLDPANPLANATTYTATVRGGASGVKDSSGNAMAGDQVWSFTTSTLPPPGGDGCPCSIWAGSTVPANETEPNDDDPVEVGVKFRPLVDGQITGIRFYKGTTNTGTHVGHLWAAGGTMLAEATFAGETPNGWQEVALANPVDVTAGTTYIASYHAPVGNYAWNRDFFVNAVDNPPLRALSNAEGGGNGVYGYGPSGTFPSNTFRSENYWVDVVFRTDAVDQTRPTVAATSPAADATGAAVGANVSATFSEALDAASVNGSTMELRGPGSALIPATVSYDAGNRRAVLDPTSALAEDTIYTAIVKGGAAGIKDRAGNTLASDFSWSFRTAPPPPPPPDDGPGGPILAISKASNPFSRYYAEILRAEGLNSFTAKDISTVTPAVLAAHDVAIVGDFPLTTAQVAMLTDWVNAGGNLIAMRPDKQLAGLLGLLDASGTLGDAYMRVDTSRAPGTGIVGETMQFHGVADRYVTNGATTLATLFTNAGTSTPNPAVTVRDVGSAGGQAAAFSYDLARSVVYTRQGNPAWDGQERDGSSPIRSDDLFFGGSLPDWNDLTKVAIPQADEQQRLLANLIGQMNADKKPLPRFWYFPRGEKAVVVMTGDDHGNGGTSGRFNSFQTASPAGCSVAQWDCVRGSSYIYPDTPLTDAQAASYVAQGFEIGLHPNTGCGDYTFASLQTDYADQLADFASEFPSVPDPVTSRTHCIAWSDWASQAKVELQHGIRLDTNYYYWPPQWVNDVPGMFTGSGMPMRFADLDGTMIDVYQATTQMTDESDQTYPFTINTLLDRALGATGYYGAFTANMHTDSNNSPGATGAAAIVSSALSRSVPVVSGKQMLDWVDGRNASSFGSIAYASGTLSFRVTAAGGATGLRGMVPAVHAGNTLTQLTRDGTAVSFTREVVKGVEYATFPATTGNYQARYAPDTAGPGISGLQATPNANGTATIAWSTDEPADARVDYGTSPTALTLNATRASLASTHSIQLTGLTPGATYHYRVRSADGASNATTSPAAPAAPATFTVPVNVDSAPNATVIETGTAGGGTAAALTADDNVFFQVNSTTSGTRTTSFYGSFTGVANGLANLRVNYRGRNSASCTQTVDIWRWTTSTWVQLDSRAVSTTEISVSNLAPTGAAADYVSGTAGDGEVRVRARCTRTANFQAFGELMRISYVR
jgi:methionine-rich copper-binding protein CopC